MPFLLTPAWSFSLLFCLQAILQTDWFLFLSQSIFISVCFPSPCTPLDFIYLLACLFLSLSLSFSLCLSVPLSVTVSISLFYFSLLIQLFYTAKGDNTEHHRIMAPVHRENTLFLSQSPRVGLLFSCQRHTFYPGP